MIFRKPVKLSETIIEKYHDVFHSQYKHIILTSGRAGTKSSFAAIKADYQLMAKQDVCSIVVLRKHHNKLRKTVYKEMLRGINRLRVPKKYFTILKSPMEITYNPTGATMYFTGSDSIDDTKGIIDEDHPIRLVILDELTEFFDDGEGEDEIQNIEATFVRGNDGGFQMLYLFNPPKNPNAAVNKWVRKMEKRPDTIHLHTDYRDVPPEWLGRDLIESAEALKEADERQYRWVWLGIPVGVDEVIYYMFSPGHVVRPDPDEQSYRTIGIGGDYGQQNATTFQAFGLNENTHKLEGLAEYYHSGRDSGRQRTPSQYAEDLIEMMDGLHEDYRTSMFYVFLDPSARGLIEEIKRVMRSHVCDYSVKLRDAENDVALGISRVQKVMSSRVLSVSPRQEMLLEEIGTYEYDKKSIERGKEQPVKVNDHCCDAMRYLVMGFWKMLKYYIPAAYRDAEEDEEETDD